MAGSDPTLMQTLAVLVGANWEIRKWLSLHCEGGFLGSRTNVAGSLTFRF